jgi:hypothetical protein
MAIAEPRCPLVESADFTLLGVRGVCPGSPDPRCLPFVVGKACPLRVALPWRDTRFERYAIYWTPAPGTPLAELGALWFGGLETFGLNPGLAARATKAPSPYGLHATFKAPFRLREGISPRDLQEALEDFCNGMRPPPACQLAFARHQRYLTLMLKGHEADIDWLAAECVTHFDRFRAPLEDKDRKRREIDVMSPRQAALLENFGYPYVLSEFRFHISLAGPLNDRDMDEVEKALAPHMAPVLAAPLQIHALTLLGEPCDGGIFQPISRHPFYPQIGLDDARG